MLRSIGRHSGEFVEVNLSYCCFCDNVAVVAQVVAPNSDQQNLCSKSVEVQRNGLCSLIFPASALVAKKCDLGIRWWQVRVNVNISSYSGVGTLSQQLGTT